MMIFRLLPAFGRPRGAAARAHGFTLVEVVIAIGVLALGTMGGISAFMLLNRYAANLRNLSVARALCQERIEQALTLPFVPTSSVVPMAPNSDPTTKTASTTLPILGPATSYNTSTGAYIGGANAQTSSENIPVYTQSDGTTANNSANVTYNRVTKVAPTAYTYIMPNGTIASLDLVVFTVTVTYVAHDQTYSTAMSTLRSVD